MSEAMWRVAEEIRIAYRSIAHLGVRSPGTGQLNAARAEAYREVLALVLRELLHRQPTSDELAIWLAGRPLPVLEAALMEPTSSIAEPRSAAEPVLVTTFQ